MGWQDEYSLRRIAEALEQANRDNRNLSKALYNIDLQALEEAEREEDERQKREFIRELDRPIAKEISFLPK